MAQWAGFSDSGLPPPSAPLSLSPRSAHLGGTKKQGEDQRSRGDDRGAGGTTEEHGGGDRQLTQQLWPGSFSLLPNLRGAPN